MFLSKTSYPLLGTCSTQEDGNSSRHDRKSVDWDVKLKNKQANFIGYKRANL